MMRATRLCAAAMDAIRALSAEVETLSGFKQLGAQEEGLPRLANAALLDVCTMFNLRYCTRDDIIGIYRNAMQIKDSGKQVFEFMSGR
ncbi:hypothetical protein CUR178_08274 [Leishmania enriettii]|uniref:Fe-containing alcohol dehydrogenase-like C-terminal domain-containing protein n=1 Tax=Leishmania enriettii TaxID=5663 RepID=A0A836KS48_LEIEN|nr:hypothetical protein CUR178_08274 [Leishmania enriettii]